MNIPSRVNPFGYDNSTPPGYMRLEFLESTGTQFIDTGEPIQLGQVFEATIQVTETSNYAANYMFGGSAEPNISWAFGIWGTHAHTGAWGYAQGGDKNGEVNRYSNLAKFEKMRVKLQRAAVEVQVGGEVLSTALSVESDSTKGTRTVYLFGVNYTTPRIYAGKIYNFAMTNPATAYKFEAVAAIYKGIPCMFDTVTRKPFYNAATTGPDFIAGFTMAQAEDLGSTIPDNTTLTVSFPWEASLVLYNSRVEYSLEQARDKGCTLSVRYREPEKDSAVYNKYAECKTVDDIFAVNPTQYGFRDDVTIDGTWMYPLPNLERVSTGWDGSLFGNNSYNTGTHPGTKVKKLILSLPKCTYCYGLVQMSPILEYLDIDLPICTYIRYLARSSGNKLTYCRLNAPMATTVYTVASYTGKLKEIEVSTPKVITAQEYFYRAYSLETVTCPEGNFDNVTNAQMMYRECRALKDFPLSYPSLKTAGSMFDGCQITGAQTIAILNSIPTWTDGASHPITMGIHIDHQNDEEVVAAITAAEEKGWTVTVQWNGTPTAQTASTFGLRKPPIYAKLSSVEHPDGTTENFLDWGHYVTNAEENGYQEFTSIEEAYEHFNLEMETEE